jgi:RecB family exonuclease
VRRLVRARDLGEFRRALVRLSTSPGVSLVPARRACILPTRASIEIFRQTLEHAALASGRATLLPPELLTRDDWLARLHDGLPDAPPLLTRFEREVIMERSARATAARTRMPKAPFDIRSGLVSEMLRLYDELRRRQRTVRRFAGALFSELGVERGTDLGSESLIHQTCFLAFAFLAYERGRAASGALDEHELRRRVAAAGCPMPFDHLIVAVADHPSDPRGLWPADFELLGRAGAALSLDVIVTDEMHDAGFRERVEQELPGIEEIRAAALPGAEETPPAGPVLVVPPAAERRVPHADPLCFVHRDREEELRDVARAVRADAVRTGHALREPVAIVFQRPLPYVYLAQHLFVEARLPYQLLDTLPLAGEPYAALLDLALEVARSGGLRQGMVALLRSPLVRFDVDGQSVAIDDAAALDLVLSERRSAGDPGEYPREVEAYFGGRPSRNGVALERAMRAARASAAIARDLRPVREAAGSSSQIRTLSAFLRAHEHAPGGADAWGERFRRGRAALLGVLEGLAEACARHDDRPREVDALTATIHHWIERHTFAPARPDAGGVRLLDAVAARFGEFDHLHVVGLVEHEWPERTRRTIFYTSGLLKSIGWPQERDHARAEQAAFRDLMRLPARTVHLHGFLLEGDTVVALSPFVELARGMETREMEALALDLKVQGSVLTETETHDWRRARLARPPLDDRRYSGFVGPQAPHPYRVSRVDRYVDCPFKYFAENVLGLPEEREEQSGLSPLERGALVHTLFEEFYRAWHAEGRRTITPGTLPVALDMFGRLAREALAKLPAPDRALEEVRLLGSIVARGVAERIFELEADAGGEIVDRLLEVVLRGPVAFPKLHGLDQRVIEISGKADRIDVFRNGELRVIDYKLSRLPDTDTSIQIAAYAHAARQQLEATDGKPHLVTQAMYLAFGDERQTEGRLAPAGQQTVAEIQARASVFADVIERIERGEFPARPLRTGDCSWCRYAGVCRKEYLVEDAPEENAPEESESSSAAGRASGGGAPRATE